MKKIDVILSLTIGEVIAWLFYITIANLQPEVKVLNSIFEMKYFVVILAIIFPLITFFCLWLSWLIGKKLLFVFQMAKYVLIGVFATLVDLGILNVLIFTSGFAAGWHYNVFKGISFLFATCSKYLGDKFWAFEQMERKEMKKEFTEFFLVTLVGLVINIGVAAFVVNFLGYHILTLFGSQLGLTQKMIANLGAIAAAIGAALWNFFAYKFIVFKK